MCIVKLQQFFRTNIKYFYFLIISTWCNSSSIGMVFYLIYNTIMLSKGTYSWFWRDIPKFKWFIITAWRNLHSIRTKYCTSNPVIMCVYSCFKFFLINSPNFNSFIIWSTYQVHSIIRKIDRSYWAIMTFKYIWFCILPKSNCHIFTTRSYNRSWWMGCNSQSCRLVTY